MWGSETWPASRLGSLLELTLGSVTAAGVAYEAARRTGAIRLSLGAEMSMEAMNDAGKSV